MRSLFNKVAVAVILCALVVIGFRLTEQKTPASEKNETVFERVLRTNVIRCGYIIYPPYLQKDPNTGTMSGPAFDVAQAVAKELNVTLNWVEETGWGTFQEGLNANRYDMMCVPVWQSGGRARAALLAEPVYYNAMYAIARVDDVRFDKTLDSINAAGIRVLVEDGNPVQATRRQRFPLSSEVTLPQMSSAIDAPMSVATRKADIYFDNIVNLRAFNAASARKLKIVGGGKPLQVFANVFAIRKDAFAFKAALDSTIHTLRDSGELPLIVAKYTPDIIDEQPRDNAASTADIP